jgi:hypothetical protein
LLLRCFATRDYKKRKKNTNAGVGEDQVEPAIATPAVGFVPSYLQNPDFPYLKKACRPRMFVHPTLGA